MTHFLDLGGTYGNDDAQQNKLRTFFGGLLKSSIVSSSDRRFLPFNKAGTCTDERGSRLCFEAGDPRASQNMMLVSVHTRNYFYDKIKRRLKSLILLFKVWMREHNRIANELSELNPTWSDESLFQEAKRITIAEYQNVIYSEWLPILGKIKRFLL